MFRHMSVDVLDDAEPLCQVIQGSNGAELNDEGLFWFGQQFSRFGRLSHGPDDIFRTAQVLLPDDLGFAVDALALPGIIIGLAADHFLGDTRHG